MICWAAKKITKRNILLKNTAEGDPAVFFVEKLLKAQYSKDIKLYEFNKLK